MKKIPEKEMEKRLWHIANEPNLLGKEMIKEGPGGCYKKSQIWGLRLRVLADKLAPLPKFKDNIS